MIEAYIRAAAVARGIDPDIAVRVAKAEGGLSDPTRRAEYSKGGAREPSYGPFQLLIGGSGTGFPEGLGNRAVSAGIDPRDPNQWQKGVDFALDEVKRDGWRQWYGAGRAGIDRWDGVNGKVERAPLPDINPYAAMPDGPKGQEAYSAPAQSPQPQGFGPGPSQDTLNLANGVKKPSIWERLEMMGKLFDAGNPDAPRIGGGLNPGDNKLLSAALNGPSVGSDLLKKRLGFLIS